MPIASKVGSIFRSIFGGRSQSARNRAEEHRQKVRAFLRKKEAREGRYRSQAEKRKLDLEEEERAYDVLRELEVDEKKERDRQEQTVDDADWHQLNSSNVDRIRYGQGDAKLQVVFKNGALYEFYDVEPSIFMGYLRTHSPGQYHWYVIRAYGYRYAKLSGGHSTEAAAPPRFDGKPFAVPDWVQDLQKRAARSSVDENLPVSTPFRNPPAAYRG